MQSPSDSDLRDILLATRTIAILGAHPDPHRPACYVPDYLITQGYTLHPVNPMFVGRSLWNSTFVASLTDLTTPIDMVDVFRRTDTLMQHVPELLRMNPLPKVVWLQLGIAHAEFARVLQEAGIRVIQDQCTLAEHRRLGLTSAG